MVFQLLGAVVGFLMMTLVLFWVTNEAQDDTYMDEVFHVPQARQYCDGNFTTWDPMITTLPGLYLASLPVIYPIAVAFSGGLLLPLCTTTMLRGVNVVFALGNFYLLYLIAVKLHPNTIPRNVVLTALGLATFPVLYFFSFLYYTDPVSTFFTLLTYFHVLHSRHGCAALAGTLAIICRQTNIMWVVFGAGITVGKIVIQWIQLDKKHGGCHQENAKMSDLLVLQNTLCLILRSFRHNPKELVILLVDVLKSVWCYILVVMGFAAFVVINEGIVVGDRSNHQPCMNFPQLFYFLLFTTFFSVVHMVSIPLVKIFLNETVKNPFKAILFFLVAVLFISKFMFIHEYNLADNRHYNFYFLSKLIRRTEYSKFFFVPAYWYGFVIFWKLLEKKDIFWKLSFIICITATIIPQRMLEFRYFIMPYLIFRLNMPMPSTALLLTEILFYFSVNAMTVYMYVYKPFPWVGSNSPQRFMW